MSRIAVVVGVAASLIALGACTVNTAPPVVATPAPSTTIINPPPPTVSAAPGNTVVVPGRY